MKFFVLVFTLFAFSENSYSFSWSKCKSYLSTPGRSLFGIGILSATTQFSSTWGPCTGLGMNKEDEIKLFYYVNFDHIKSDIAKGSGDYLNGFLQHRDCNKKGVELKLRRDYFQIFNGDMSESYNAINDNLRISCPKVI